MTISDLPSDERVGATDENGALRLLSARLSDARHILALAFVVLALLVIAGRLAPLAGFAVMAAVAIGAALPRRSRTMRLAQRRQRQSELSWHRAIELPLNAMDEAAYILRADGTVKFQNDAAIAMFGVVEPDAHLSRRIRSPAILAIVEKVIRDGDPATVEHNERVPAERWLTARCAPLSGTPSQEPTARLYLLTFRDMSEARRMDRMRTDFVANASHELRTPLASLTGFIETIRGPARSDAKAQAQFLDIMYDQATRMTRLVDDLMSLSRLELKAHVAPTAAVDIARVLEHVCGALRPLADELGVALAFTPPETRLHVRGDEDELIQVFQNLVENACKYGQSGGRVDLSLRAMAGNETETGEDMVEVTVRDYGPGIAAEHVPRLTERFYRVDIESSRSKKGTGLGLAIVKHILTRHRSRLIVRSQKGQGASFIVRLARVARYPDSGKSEENILKTDI
nr:ATP-binding protein [Pararhizobium haloflavum]